MLIDNPTVVVIGIVVAVVALAIWKGKALKVSVGKFFTAETTGETQGPAPDRVTVGHRARFEDASVGNITGRARKGAPRDRQAVAALDTSVASNATFKRTTVGDLTGIKETAGTDTDHADEH